MKRPFNQQMRDALDRRQRFIRAAALFVAAASVLPSCASFEDEARPRPEPRFGDERIVFEAGAYVVKAVERERGE